MPSGANARAVIGTLGPRSVARSVQAATSQSRTVRSAPQLARVLPSGENARDRTGRVWPFRVAKATPTATSQMVTTPSAPAVAIVEPSGETAIDRATIARRFEGPERSLRVQSKQGGRPAGRRQRPAVGGEDEDPGVDRLAPPEVQLVPGGGIPEPERIRTRADGERGQDLAVGREGELNLLGPEF